MNKPTTLSELYTCSLGTSVYDAHDGMPQWFKDLVPTSHEIPRGLAQTAILALRPTFTNKLVYVIEQGVDSIFLAYTYDAYGFIIKVAL